MKKVYLVHVYIKGLYDHTESIAFSSLKAARLYADEFVCSTQVEEVDVMSFSDVMINR